MASQPLSSVTFCTWWTCRSWHTWVVAVLNDSCSAQCLKLSSNVWRMVCVCVSVSLWPVTLMAPNYPVTDDWLCGRWGAGKSQSINLKEKTAQCDQLHYHKALTNLLRSPTTIPCTCVINKWKCLIIGISFGVIVRMKAGNRDTKNVFLRSINPFNKHSQCSFIYLFLIQFTSLFNREYKQFLGQMLRG